MSRTVLQKKRRFRIDPNNPYRTRFMIYSLVEDRGKYKILAEQFDYVLRSQVAEDRSSTPEIENQGSARQLLEYMLENVKSIHDIAETYQSWRKGKLSIVNETNNVLVKEAIRRRFARNLKKL